MDPSFSSETQHQAAVFDTIGAQYEQVFGSNQSQRAAVQWLIERLPAGARVLDVGSGTGVPTAQMLAEAGMDVIGVDISQEMVRLAQKNVPQATFHVMDMANLHIDIASFQAITAFFSLLMLRKATIEATIERLVHLLEPGGYFVASLVDGDFDYIEIPFLDQTVHVSAYSKDVFTEMLQQHSLMVLDVQTVQFSASAEAPLETQHFFFCQRAEA